MLILRGCGAQCIPSCHLLLFQALPFTSSSLTLSSYWPRLFILIIFFFTFLALHTNRGQSQLLRLLLQMVGWQSLLLQKVRWRSLRQVFLTDDHSADLCR